MNRTVTVTVPDSAEELAMEVSSRIRSVQQQSGRFRQRIHRMIQSSSGEFLDSVIEINIRPWLPAEDPSDEVNQSGPSRERHDHDDEDSLFDFPTDSGIGANRNSLPRQNEGPLMTTRRF